MQPERPRNWSDEGASYEGAEAIEPTRKSKRGKIEAAFRVMGSLTTGQLVALGGSDGPRRCRELAQMGWKFDKQHIAGSPEFLYTVIDWPESS